MFRSGYYLKSFLFLLSTFAVANLPTWTYDPGPDLSDPLQKELVDLVARIPNAPEISERIVGQQRFRPAYGPIPWRMILKKDSVKILFIGQDGTHIAEAAGRPATAGFGGRAQDLAAYFGVNEGAAFINTFAFTINGQYATAKTPFIDLTNGKRQLGLSTFIDNKFWLVSQDQDSPVAKWRNDLIDWIIRNNKNSLQLIVAFGGAAKDSVGSFLRSKNIQIHGSLDQKTDQIQLEETALAYAGGNNQFAVPVDGEGRDLYQRHEGKLDYTKPADEAKALSGLRKNLEAYLPEMIFSRGGPHKNGILDSAQMGGYRFEEFVEGKKQAFSLAGITLTDGSKVTRDIPVIQLPHPTFLSMADQAHDEAIHNHKVPVPKTASELVAEDLVTLDVYVKRGWKIEPDPEQVNHFSAGDAYKYSRTDIGPEYYDFGTPASRMVSVSSASRMTGSANSHIIIFGSRERGVFSREDLDRLTNFKPAAEFSSEELFTARPRSESLRYTFDPGPGEKFARLMKENLKFSDIYRTKDGCAFNKDKREFQEMPIDNFNIKTHPMIEDFGHYRGTFTNPKVVVLADPDGFDDLITARALTGERGQYLQGFMSDLGVGDQYLVIKTVPFGMDGATDEEWKTVLAQTQNYRAAIFAEIFKNSQPDFVLADGKWASAEMASLVPKENEIPVVEMLRGGTDKAEGIEKASSEVKKIPHYSSRVITLQRANIPRSHLSFYARVWEGTSGDRVLNSSNGLKGRAFAEVAPKWAWDQQNTASATHLLPAEKFATELLLKKLDENNLPQPNEKLIDFIKRRNITPGL